MQNGANRISDVAGRESCGCHLIEEGLKQVMVAAIDDRHFDRGAPQHPCRVEPAKTRPDDDDSAQLPALICGATHNLIVCHEDDLQR